MSKKFMGANEYEAFVEEYIDYTEDCEFPVKVSSKRSRRQRQMAAKKNRFPVNLRKEIRSERRCDKEYRNESYNKAFWRSERKILQLVIEDMILEKTEQEKKLEELRKADDLFYARLIAERYMDEDRFNDRLDSDEDDASPEELGYVC